MSLEAVRDAIDTCPESETAAFARRTRNALANAILASALAREAPEPPAHGAPVAELRRCVGDELGELLAEIYEGGEDWTSRAIDALPPLHALARP
ncbi:MAG TPA: hypothetical protein VHC67_18645 [Gaiellaceae bacterium]|nr:hypothetical protein [Gaiellaceae bacterium]